MVEVPDGGAARMDDGSSLNTAELYMSGFELEVGGWTGFRGV